MVAADTKKVQNEKLHLKMVMCDTFRMLHPHK